MKHEKKTQYKEREQKQTHSNTYTYIGASRQRQRENNGNIEFVSPFVSVFFHEIQWLALKTNRTKYHD